MGSRKPVIVGVADAPLKDGKFVERHTPLQAQALVARAALAEAGLTLADVDGLLSAGIWGIPGPGLLMTLTLCEYLGIQPEFVDGTNVGGSSFESHVGHAATAIETGVCDVALIVYGSAQRSERSRSLGGRPAVLTMQYDTPFGLATPVGSYALAAMRYMHEFNVTPEQVAEVAVASRKWAVLNEAAMLREPLTAEDVLASPMICEPLRVRDCCLATDGAGAVVMTTEERARDLKSRPIRLRGWGEAQTHWLISEMKDLTRVESAEMSGKRALAMAGMSLADLDVVQIYDSFTITVLLTLEALGFCGRGEAANFVADQRTTPGGAFPMNTSGGGLSCLHPGMFGIFLLIEAVRQLRDECGARQVRDAKAALVHGTGAHLSSGATCILTRM